MSSPASYKYERVKKLYEQGHTVIQIYRITNYNRQLIGEFLKEFDLNDDIEYFNVNKYDCWICPSNARY